MSGSGRMGQPRQSLWVWREALVLPGGCRAQAAVTLCPCQPWTRDTPVSRWMGTAAFLPRAPFHFSSCTEEKSSSHASTTWT